MDMRNMMSSFDEIDENRLSVPQPQAATGLLSDQEQGFLYSMINGYASVPEPSSTEDMIMCDGLWNLDDFHGSFSANKALMINFPAIFTSMIRCYHTSAAGFSLNLLHFLQHSIDSQSLKLAQQCHAQIHRSGLTQDSVLATKLISAYSTCRNAFDSRQVFDSIEAKSVYIYNALINGYAKNSFFAQSIDLFEQMCAGTVLPDEFTFSGIVKVLGESGDFVSGRMVHCMCEKKGFVLDTVVGNSFMSMYVKGGSLHDALKVFDELPCRNLSSWNGIISGYANLRDQTFEKSLWEFVREMQTEGWKFDAITVSTLLSFCAEDKKTWHYGRELHCYVLKNGLKLEVSFDDDAHLGCCLIDIYSKSGRVDSARKVFERLIDRNVYAWTAIINGYAQNGDFMEAFAHFFEMQMEGIKPNKVSLVSILPACGSVASLKGGKQVHGFAIRHELNREVSFCNALIDMYFKTGSLSSARKLFQHSCNAKDRISWSSMIVGYGLHGRGQEAVRLFDEMLQHGIKPDMITAVAVLSACARAGLVDNGIRVYRSVLNDYHVKPTLEMCSCMVDLFGRSGQLERALDFINTMPVPPGASVWGALMNASALHGNDEMRELAYNFLVQIEPENPANYVSLSNLYASSQKWDVVSRVRTLMKERGLKKLPGLSWINISNETHSFYIFDKAHPCSNMIYERLDELSTAMKEAGLDSEFEGAIKLCE
nr:putative pentatricopeptide repeat-containing protein At3g05240 [Ipomoea batatas]